MKAIEKVWSSSLKFLENPTVVLILTVVLVLLSSTLFSNINDAIRGIFSNKIVRLIVIILIVYISPKNPTVGILLAIVYLLSITPYEHFDSEPASYPFGGETLLQMQDNNSGDQTNEEKKDKDTSDINKALQERQGESAQLAKQEHFENQGEEEEEDEEAEHFIPFLSNNDFESGSFASPQQKAQGNCLSTNPNGFELVGNACAPVQAFTGEYNAQGMNAITGFNLDHQMTAQPL